MTEIKQHTWGRRRKVPNSLGTYYRVCETCGVSDAFAEHHSGGGFCEPRPSYAELVAELERLREALKPKKTGSDGAHKLTADAYSGGQP